MISMQTKFKSVIRTVLCTLPFFGSAMFMTTSCSDLLDKQPYGALVAEQMTEDNATQLMTSAYAGLYSHYFGNNEAFAGPSTNWIFDVRSDDALKGGGATSMEENIHQLEMSNLTSDNVSCFNKWQNNLYALACTNSALKAMKDANNDNFKGMIAEMQFLRCFYYFDLLKIFKYLPYLDETTNANEVRNDEFSQVEIYDKLLPLLEAAYNDLPETQASVGRANKYAAAALLAKMYAQRPGATNWTKVEEWAGKVVKSGQYELYEYSNDIAKIEYNNKKESIFAMQCSTANSHAFVNWANMLNCTWSEGNLYGNGDDFFLASQDLVNCYRTDEVTGLPLLDDAERYAKGDVGVSLDYTVDPRLDCTVGRIGMPWKSPDGYTQIYNQNWVRAMDIYSEYSGKKFVEEPSKSGKEVPWGYSELNFIFLRYADILLLHAEALIELGSDLATANAEINQVRQKAERTLQAEATNKPIDIDSWKQAYRVGQYPNDSKWTQDYARKAVRMERRLELAMEGGRWFDLVRWGIAEQTMNAYYSREQKKHSYLQGASVTADELYLPVPLAEITNSNGKYLSKGKEN